MKTVLAVSSVITSRIDSNYYIIDDNTSLELVYLSVLLKEINEIDCCNLIFQYLDKLKMRKRKLFIEKNSFFGKVITRLIVEKKIIDVGHYIYVDTLFNALAHEFKKDNLDYEYLEYLHFFIKHEIFGEIDELSLKYPREILKKIAMEGRAQEYKKVFSYNLTGFEEEGYIYDQENGWCLFNIVNKNCVPIQDIKYDKKKKSRVLK